MPSDRDRLTERLDPAAVRDSLEERIDGYLDGDAVRERIDAGLDPGTVRSTLDEFYARYFLPPSVTGGEIEAESEESVGADIEPFDFGAWLEEGRGSGPAKPPAEPRVVTEAAAPAVDPEADFGAFDFEAWLAEGGEFEPVDVLEPQPEPEVSAGAVAVEPEATDEPLPGRPTVGIHPVKAATFALFLAVVALVALTVAGHLPALGPTGFAG